MKVKCINDIDWEHHITNGKIYEVTKEGSNYYFITNNYGMPYTGYGKSRFEIIPETKPMKIRCNNAGCNPHLTNGKTYEAISETGNYYTIVANDGHQRLYCKSRFEIVKEDEIMSKFTVVYEEVKTPIKEIKGKSVHDGDIIITPCGKKVCINFVDSFDRVLMPDDAIEFANHIIALANQIKKG